LKNVRFLGSFPRHRMPELVASADIALVPLKCPIPGAVPSKLYEAMGSGVPVILAAEGEAAEIVQSTCCGVVVSPGDSVGVARALRELAANHERRREMGARGAEAALRYFDRHQIATEFISYLEKELKC
jgi:glycosyltransferase involved in cell wall biosynthesis